MMRLKNALSSSNKFSTVIYEAPVCTGDFSWSKRRELKKMQKKYFKKEVLPIYKKLKYETASFETMCDFADFIKQMELSMFFNNSVANRDNSNRNNLDEKDKKNIIICDTNTSSSEKKKVLRILMERENVLITFAMYLSESEEQIIDVNVRNNFGSKMTTNFHIVDQDTSFTDVHSYNLLNNVNVILQNTMAETFLSIYKDSLTRGF